jgi:hypothetical protein
MYQWFDIQFSYSLVLSFFMTIGAKVLAIPSPNAGLVTNHFCPAFSDRARGGDYVTALDFPTHAAITFCCSRCCALAMFR